MFTGLVEDIGRIEAVQRTGGSGRLAIATSLPAESFATGDSVAVSGACLTVVSSRPGRIEADVSPETLAVTTLGSARAGDAVNLERAMQPSGRLGGHFVLGHVDGVCRVKSVSPAGGYTGFSFAVPPDVARYLVTKGSVAVDGVSLTVNEAGGRAFSVMVIPHTLSKTTLGGLKAGSQVNVECDVLGKYVAAFLGRRSEEGVTMEDLARAGFLES
jgi:riboflavin synthase